MTKPAVKRHYRPRSHRAAMQAAGFVARQVPIRSSAWETLRECPRKFLFRYRYGLVRKGTLPGALYRGNLFHKIVEEVYKGMSPEKSGWIVSESVRTVVQEWSALADHGGLLPDGSSLSDRIAELDKDSKLAMAMANMYFRLFPLEQLRANYDIVAVEGTVDTTLLKKFPARVKIDLLLYKKGPNPVWWILDHKTTSLSPSARAAVCPFEFQGRLYRQVVEQEISRLFPGRSTHVAGVIHNIIKTPSIRFSVKTDRTIEGYCERVKEWYQEQATLTPNDPPVLSSTVRYGSYEDQDQRDFFQQIRLCGRACTRQPRFDSFYRDEGACFGRFGSRPCPYLDLCRSERHIDGWPKLLTENFEQSFREDQEDK